MSNPMSNVNKLAAAVFAVAAATAAQDASATCGSNVTTSEPGKPPVTVFVPSACPPVPAPTPAPSPTPSPTPAPAPVYNGGNAASQAAAAAAAQAAAQAAAAANASNTTKVNTNVTSNNTNQVSGTVTGTNTLNNTTTATGGKSESTSGVTTGNIGSNSSAVTGASTSSAKTGDVSVDGSNNSSYSNTTTYKAAAASAISSGVVSSGHGCFRAKGGFSLGVQTVAGGVSATIGGGEEYETAKIKSVDADGKEIEIEGNRCAVDQVNLATIAAGATPYATDAQIAMAAQTAAEASPDAKRALNVVLTNDNLVSKFGRKAYPTPAPAPVSNTYVTAIIDKTGAVTTFNCPKGTKPVVDQNGAPVIDKATGLPTCQPG